MTAAVATMQDTNRRNGLIWVAVVGALQVATTSFGIGPPLQPLLSVVFVLTCPGFLLLDLDRPRDFSARLLIGVGGSIGINIAIATVVLVAEARWLAPALALALVAVAALPKGRLRSAASKLASIVSPEPQPQPQLALPAGDPTPGIVPIGAAVADLGETQVGEEVAFGDLPEVSVLEVPVLDEATEAPALIDINTADANTMTSLPGVGPTLAVRIVAYRRDHGPFETFEELLEVPGIGPSKLRGFPAVAHLTQPPPEEQDVLDLEGSDRGDIEQVDIEEPAAEARAAEVVETAEPVEPVEPRVVGAEVVDAELVDVEAEAGEAGAGEAGAGEAGADAGEADAEVVEAEVVDADAGEADAEVVEIAEPVVDDGVADEVEVVGGAGALATGATAETVAPTPAPADDRLDINAAQLDQLVRLPGIGPDLAVRIFTYRAGHGPFVSTAGLRAVSGVGPAKLRLLETLVWVPSPDQAPVQADENDAEEAVAPGVIASAEGDVAEAAAHAADVADDTEDLMDALPDAAVGSDMTRDDDGVATSAGETSLPEPSTTSGVEAADMRLVDINWADATRLINVPGIGPQLAERILSYRDQHGFFSTVDELGNVKGVAASKLDQLRPYLTV